MLHHRFYDWLTRNQTFAVEWAPLSANTHPTLTSNEGKKLYVDLWLSFYISCCIQVTDQAARLKAKYFVLYRWIQWTFITSLKSNWFGTIPVSKCTQQHFTAPNKHATANWCTIWKKKCSRNTNEFRCVYKPIDVRIVYISKETIVLGTFHLLECLFHACEYFFPHFYEYVRLSNIANKKKREYRSIIQVMFSTENVLFMQHLQGN